MQKPLNTNDHSYCLHMHRSSRVCNLLEIQLIIVHFIGRRTAAQLLLHSICVITAAQPYPAFDVASE